MPVPDAVLLLAMRRTDTRIHVEQNAPRGTPGVNTLNPAAGQIGERREVFPRRQPARLETAHLAGRRRATMSRLASDDPAHRGITPEPIRVVHIFVPGEAAKHGLAELREQRVAAVLPRAGIVEQIGGEHRQAEGLVELPEREQPGVGGDGGAMEFELQAAVKNSPEAVHLAVVDLGAKGRMRPDILAHGHPPLVAAASARDAGRSRGSGWSRRR